MATQGYRNIIKIYTKYLLEFRKHHTIFTRRQRVIQLISKIVIEG